MKIKAKLGDVLHSSGSSGNLIIKLETETHIGELVYDNKGNRVGAVFDIFGPVKSPFASIKIQEGAKENPKTLFLGEKTKQRKSKYRSSRRRKQS